MCFLVFFIILSPRYISYKCCVFCLGRVLQLVCGVSARRLRNVVDSCGGLWGWHDGWVVCHAPDSGQQPIDAVDRW